MNPAEMKADNYPFRRLRKKAKLTQAEFAALFDTSQASISRYEKIEKPQGTIRWFYFACVESLIRSNILDSSYEQEA